MNSIKYLVTALLVSCLTGCVSTWKLSDGEKIKKDDNLGITAQSPDNWYKKETKQMVLFTRHGPGLEYIFIQKIKWNDTLSNGKTVPKSLLLHELPEIVLGDRCSQESMFKFSITSGTIIPVDSFYCTETAYAYTSSNTLRMKGLLYCIPFKKYLTVVTYEAEESCYYKRSVKDFKKMISSLTINNNNYRLLPGMPERTQ